MIGSADPILYSFRRCPYAIRARLALAISGTSYELREVHLRAKPASMLLLSPKGTVPVLVLPTGQVIDESLDVMRWALSRHDPEGWLERNDAAVLALADKSFKHDLDRYKYPERHGSDPIHHRQGGLMFLHELEARLSLKPQLCGSRRGFADAAIVPFVRQFAAVDRTWFAIQPLPHLRAWLKRYLESDLFRLVMGRAPIWSPGYASGLTSSD